MTLDTPRARLDERTRELFNEYFSSVNENTYTFGICAEKLGHKTKDLSRFTGPAANLETQLKIPFLKDGIETLEDDYVIMQLRHNIDKDFILSMNRKYNGKDPLVETEDKPHHSLAALSALSRIDTEHGYYEICVASSEIARSHMSAIYDIAIEIKKDGKQTMPIIKEKYAMQCRLKNSGFTISLLDDIKTHLRTHESANEAEITSLMRKDMKDDERYCQVHFANIETPETIIEDKFSVRPEQDGFKIWYEMADKTWHHTFYHNTYKKDINKTDIEIQENNIERDVFNIMNLKHGSIQNKLKACMIMVNNRRKLEEEHPEILEYRLTA